jgi:hypothetical protein
MRLHSITFWKTVIFRPLMDQYQYLLQTTDYQKLTYNVKIVTSLMNWKITDIFGILCGGSNFMFVCHLRMLSALRLYSVHDKMINEYGAVGEMRIGKGYWNMCRKPAPLPLCPPHIPHDLAYNLIWAAAVRGGWLTAWAVSQPRSHQICTQKDGSFKPWLWILYYDSHEQLCWQDCCMGMERLRN